MSYVRTIRSCEPPTGSIAVDVYAVLECFGVTCPAIQHAVKKLLCAGERGHKDRLTDLQEAVVAVVRAVELERGRRKP